MDPEVEPCVGNFQVAMEVHVQASKVILNACQRGEGKYLLCNGDSWKTRVEDEYSSGRRLSFTAMDKSGWCQHFENKNVSYSRQTQGDIP